MTAAVLVWLIMALGFLAATGGGFIIHWLEDGARRRAFNRHAAEALRLANS